MARLHFAPPMRTNRLSACRSYLLGAMHDGTVHGLTVRITQKEESYVAMIRALITASGGRAWTYREGKQRDLHVVEFSLSFMEGHQLITGNDRVHYVRGFFDAEGGIPSDPLRYPYIYFAQKNRAELQHLRQILELLGIGCGSVHCPSHHADPDYWRFYVSRASHERFALTVGSWHPRKGPILRAMAAGQPRESSGTPGRSSMPSLGSTRSGYRPDRGTPPRGRPMTPSPPSGRTGRRGPSARLGADRCPGSRR